ncbi:MAG: hypothetical protein HY660_00565, partial [Armatimonadetes bacterium]|nr:hypothetical protein [Armatimonadota bacterium]
VDRLYDNWFIETCGEWVVPYIGDLLSVRGLLPVRDGAFSQRPLVANTVAFRRRKGTAAVLEDLARAATGWPAHAVEFFELLAATQYINHVRPGKGGTAGLRDASALQLLGGPFERAARTAEVRHIDVGRGKYNIPHLGLFLWRLQSYHVARVTARPVPAANAAEEGRFRFSPLGHDAPLFNVPRTETEITQLASELNVPGPLRRRPLYDELEARRQAIVDGRTPRPIYFGDQPVLRVLVNNVPVPPEQIAICDLSDPPPSVSIPEGWQRPAATRKYTPSSGGAEQSLPIKVAVDPVLGRLAFPAGAPPGPVPVEVSYACGFAGDLGGGPYDRRGSVQRTLTRPVTWQMGVTKDAPANHPQLVKTLAEAVRAWNQRPAGTVGVIAIMDSRTYQENLTDPAPPASIVQIPAGSLLLIVAADWPEEESPAAPGQPQRVIGHFSPSGRRPHLRGNLSVRGTAAAGNRNPGTLVVNGLLIEGTLTVLPGNLGGLTVAHATLVPGSGGLTASASAQAGQHNELLAVTLERAISGAVSVADTVRALRIEESIIDGGGGTAITAPATEVQISTVLGPSTLRSLEAGNSIFTGKVTVARRQTGCVRFSYLPLDSRAPRRYRCQPADAATAGQILPHFTSMAYGQPGYGQLAASGPAVIRTGAEDEGEMGAFHFLQQTQRVGSLRISLDEYLPFGLEAGIFFVT